MTRIVGNDVDDVARASRKSEDEKRWMQEQRMKRTKGVLPPRSPIGCASCANWTAGGSYGACSDLAIVRFPFRTDAAYIARRSDIQTIDLPWNAEVSPLRTGAGFTCPAWTEQTNE